MRRRRIELEPSPWPTADGKGRVLVEHHDWANGIAIGNLLTAAGYGVSYCHGPEDRGGKCPLVAAGQCERASTADVVFFGLDITDADAIDVLRGLRKHFAGTPVIVELPQSRMSRYKDELEGCLVVPQPLTRKTLEQAVEQALALA